MSDYYHTIEVDIGLGMVKSDRVLKHVRHQANRIEELEAENKRLRLEVQHANDTADVAIERAKELEAKLAKAMQVVEMIASADVDAVLGQAVDISCEIIGELMEEEEDE